MLICYKYNCMPVSWLGIWAACRSNIVGRDPQHSHGNSSVPNPRAVVGDSKKKVYTGGQQSKEDSHLMNNNKSLGENTSDRRVTQTSKQ